jgi:hypothetical protein
MANTISINGIFVDHYRSNDIYGVAPNTLGSSSGGAAAFKNITYPMIIGPGSVISMDVGNPSTDLGSPTFYNFLAISGFLVDKKTDVIFSNQSYTVPANYYFVRIKPMYVSGEKEYGKSAPYYHFDYSFPMIYNANSVVPAKTNGYLIHK